jgi:hypothetical protein
LLKLVEALVWVLRCVVGGLSSDKRWCLINRGLEDRRGLGVMVDGRGLNYLFEYLRRVFSVDELPNQVPIHLTCNIQVLSQRF